MKKISNKIFSENYFVPSFVLNLLGIQALRYTLASFVYTLRGFFFKWSDSEEIRHLKRDGFLIINNFLDKKTSEYFKKNFSLLQSIGKQTNLNDGDTSITRSTLTIDECQANSKLYKVIFSEKLIDILESCEHKKFINKIFHNFGIYGQVVWLDVIRNIDSSTLKDSQKTLHSDIFFQTHKVWYFPEQVDDASGPLNFVKGSHKFNFYRLFLEYINSIDSRTNFPGSPNIRADKQPLRKYNKRTFKCTVPENTLVIANTRGYHCRGESQKKSTRMQLHFRVRRNPFEKIFTK